MRLLQKSSIVKFEGHFVKVIGFCTDPNTYQLCAQLEDKKGNVGHVPRVDIIWNGKQFIYKPA